MLSTNFDIFGGWVVLNCSLHFTADPGVTMRIQEFKFKGILTITAGIRAMMNCI